MSIYERDEGDITKLNVLEVSPLKSPSSKYSIFRKTNLYAGLCNEYEEDLKDEQYVVFVGNLKSNFPTDNLEEGDFRRFLRERTNKRGTRIFKEEIGISEAGQIYSPYNKEFITREAIQNGIVAVPNSEKFLHDLLVLGSKNEGGQERLERLISLIR